MDIDTLLRLQAEQTTEHVMLIIDRTGTIIWCNPAAARQLNCAPEALIGQPAHRVFTTEDVQRGVADFELDVAAASTDMDNDRWLQRADGSRFWASGATTALRGQNGELVAFAKTLRDRTNLKEQIELLRNRVVALVKADEHKDVFLSTLSHELRNPLAPLMNAVQLIRTIAPQNTALEYPIKLIERQVEFLRRLVDDLLDVTRINAGKIQIDLGAIDLREVIATAAETVRPLIVQRGQRFAQHLLPTPIVVNGDADRLQQVFVNLFTNAAKYTPEGGHIEVRASLDESEALVHVADDGIGIAKEMQPHIFDLFTQVDGTSARREGLGIGLSLVKNLVELHGGSVQVRSEGAGKGSEFTVRLPLAR